MKHTLVEEAIKEFRKEFYYLIPNKKQIKENAQAIIYPQTSKDLELWLTEKLEEVKIEAYTEGHRDAFKILGMKIPDNVKIAKLALNKEKAV